MGVFDFIRWFIREFKEGVAEAKSTVEEPPHNNEEIDHLVRLLDRRGNDSELAHMQLSEIGEAAIPKLISALKGGTMRRFNAARTLGKIGIDARLGLIQLGESARGAALTAAREALTYEQAYGIGQESELICQMLQRAIANLSPPSK